MNPIDHYEVQELGYLTNFAIAILFALELNAINAVCEFHMTVSFKSNI